MAENPFADMFKAWNDNTNNFDWNKASNGAKAWAEAAQAAATAMTESAQKIAKLQAEIFQRNASEASRFFRETISSAKSPEASIAKQAEFAKDAIGSAVSDSRSLFELASQANAEALNKCTKAFSELGSEFAKDLKAANSSKRKSAEAA